MAFVSNDAPSTTAAKQELLELLGQHLPRRFPNLFEERSGSICNKVTGETVSLSEEAGEDQLIRAG